MVELALLARPAAFSPPEPAWPTPATSQTEAAGVPPTHGLGAVNRPLAHKLQDLRGFPGGMDGEDLQTTGLSVMGTVPLSLRWAPGESGQSPLHGYTISVRLPQIFTGSQRFCAAFAALPQMKQRNRASLERLPAVFMFLRLMM